ncbi:hypothetical protein [Streptomyces sp. NPDC058572]|uniref:hypothetical protein n=1 Tax=Streptomyces sp. NPDC058572 TaxID=3346546 RepID=UPI00364D1B2F
MNSASIRVTGRFHAGLADLTGQASPHAAAARRAAASRVPGPTGRLLPLAAPADPQDDANRPRTGTAGEITREAARAAARAGAPQVRGEHSDDRAQ